MDGEFFLSVNASTMLVLLLKHTEKVTPETPEGGSRMYLAVLP